MYNLVATEKKKSILIVIANTYHTPIDVAYLSVRRIHSNDSSLSVSSRGVVANEPALVVALLSWRNQPLQGARSIVRMHLNTGTLLCFLHLECSRSTELIPLRRFEYDLIVQICKNA